jgi:hypothetical protein
MTAAPEVLHALLAHLADALAVYVCHQIDAGAQARALEGTCVCRRIGADVGRSAGDSWACCEAGRAELPLGMGESALASRARCACIHDRV